MLDGTESTVVSSGNWGGVGFLSPASPRGLMGYPFVLRCDGNLESTGRKFGSLTRVSSGSATDSHVTPSTQVEETRSGMHDSHCTLRSSS